MGLDICLSASENLSYGSSNLELPVFFMALTYNRSGQGHFFSYVGIIAVQGRPIYP